MFNEKLFNDVKAVSFKNTIYEYDAPEVIAQLESVIGSECFDIETTLSEVKYVGGKQLIPVLLAGIK